jgi:hypothetical protein
MRVRVRSVIALLGFLCALPLPAVAQPTAVSPFPRGLSGTPVFQSDDKTASNPAGRV